MIVTASIVTFNNEDEISTVLASLIESEGVELDITVVDNASSDDTCTVVEKTFPSVKLIKSKANLGFGAGHNLAIKNISSSYHIFVNPDIYVEKDQIKKMIDFLENNKDIVVLSPKILNPDKSEQFLPKKIPTLRYVVSGKLENKSKIFKKWRDEYTLRNVSISEPLSVDFCTGCFMVCRTEALLKVGGFDERYFLHFEDADLTREMQRYGKTVFVPFFHVVHKWHRDNLRNSKVRKIALQSMFKYFKKWRNKNA